MVVIYFLWALWVGGVQGLCLDREVLPLLGWGDSILDDHLQNTVAERRAHLSADTWNKKKADQKQ